MQKSRGIKVFELVKELVGKDLAHVRLSTSCMQNACHIRAHYTQALLGCMGGRACSILLIVVVATPIKGGLFRARSVRLQDCCSYCMASLNLSKMPEKIAS